MLPSLSTEAVVFNSDCPKNRTSTTSPGPNKYFRIPAESSGDDDDEEGALDGACDCGSWAQSDPASSTTATTGENSFETFMTPLTTSSFVESGFTPFLSVLSAAMALERTRQNKACKKQVAMIA